MRSIARTGFAGLGFLWVCVFSSAALAQELSIDTVEVPIYTEEVTVDWGFTAGGGVQGYVVDLFYDAELLTPVVEAGNQVVGCLQDVPASLRNCLLLEPGRIRISLLNLTGPFEDQAGSITFEIAADATGDDDSALVLEVAPAQTVPEGVPIAVENGLVDISWGLPALVNVETVEVREGSESATVGWSFEPGSGLQAIVFDVEFDPDLVTPVIGTGNDLVGCLDNVDASLQACRLIGDSTVRVSMTNLNAVPALAQLGPQSGTMTFMLAADASEGDFTALSLGLWDAFPVNGPVLLDDGAITVIESGPTSLAFQTSPGRGVEGQFLRPVPVVFVLDASGELVSDDNETVVEVSLASGSAGAQLGGVTSVTVVGGVAEFPDLSVDLAGFGYRLVATDSGSELESDESDVFDIFPDGLFRDRFEQIMAR